MPSISGTATFELTDFLQPNLLGTGSFTIQANHLTNFQLNIAGLSFDETDITNCQCFLQINGFPFVALEGSPGFLVWDFYQGIFSADFSAPGLVLRGNSESGSVSGVFTTNTLHAVPEPATAGLFLFGALVCVLLGRWLEARRNERRRP